MPKINHIKLLTILFVLICLLSNLEVKAQTQLKKTDSIQNFSVGLYWNASTILNNYPTWEFATQFMWKKRVSVDLGAGYVYDSELFASSKEYVNHQSGFTLTGELKYYLTNTVKNNGPYIGLGYKHLETSYSANYIAKLYDDNTRYYKYFNNDYYVRLDQFNAKFGYRLTGKDDRIFFEFGANVGARKKHHSPIPEKINGRLVTNKSFLERFNKYPLPVSLDIKIGLLLYSK